MLHASHIGSKESQLSHLMSIVWGSDSNVISSPDAKHVAAADEVVSDELHSTLWICAMYVVFCICNEQWFPKLGVRN